MPPNGTPNAEGTVDDHRGERRSERRVHLSEAAALLGVSKDAVRMRVKRGTLRSEKGENGRVYVWVNVNPDADPNTVHPQGEGEAWRELIDELRDRVRSLEDANRENRRIIAALTQRIPELPPASEPASASGSPGGPETASEGRARSGTGGPQEGADRPPDTAEWPVRGSLLRPWWRRVFGG
jgi:hypothetical protein